MRSAPEARHVPRLGHSKCFQAPTGRHDSFNGLEKVAVVVRHLESFQELKVFLTEALLRVMLFLVLDVLNHVGQFMPLLRSLIWLGGMGLTDGGCHAV